MIRLTVDATQVVLHLPDGPVRHTPASADRRTGDLVWRLRRTPSDEMARALGDALGRRFLDGAAGRALVDALARTGRHRLGLEVTDPTLADLPWETLTPPGDPVPLALHPDLDVCRVPTDRRQEIVRAEGPLRLLAAIASPDDAGQPLLDHERELGRILGAVEPGHRHGARVRVLEWGSTDAIRAALAEEPFHVLHISCHAAPGTLLLETPTGGEDRVDAARFLDEVLPGDVTVPLIVLAGCSTGSDGQRDLPGVAAALLGARAPAVVAMNGKVSDGYTIEFCARLYERLTTPAGADLVTVLSDVRRELERDPATTSEWWLPALFLAGPGLLLENGRGGDVAGAPAQGSFVDDGVLRAPSDFVGRREVLRRLSRGRLRVLVHGIGGIGKTSLAAELGRRFRATGGLVVTASGDAAVDDVLDGLRHQVDVACARQGPTAPETLRQLLVGLSDPGRDWRERLAETATTAVPLLLVLDNAEDALDDRHRLRDPQLAAFLADWVRNHELVVTSRHPFPVPGVETCHLGPLSWQETRKLLWRLPGVGALSTPEQRRMWHRLGGHPRALEYLDGILRAGAAPFEDVAARLGARGDVPAGDLGPALAEAGARVAEDVLLPQLLARLDAAPLTRRLLFGAAVYRFPVDRTGLTWQLADPPDTEEPPPEPDGLDGMIEELTRLGLLAPAAGGWLVHRWTATGLARIAGRAAVADAHRRAGWYRRWRCATTTDRHDYIQQAVEARYHHLAAGEIPHAITCTEMACQQLHVSGLWSWEEKLWRELLALTPPQSRESANFRHSLGAVYFAQGRYAQAEQRNREALAIFQALGDTAAAGKSLHQLGLIAQERADVPEAERLYEEALAILQGADDRQAVAVTLHQLAGIAHHRGDDELARTRYLEELAISRDLDDLAGIAASHHQLGVLAHRARDFVRAEECIRVALSGYDRLGDRVHVGSGRLMLGRIALARSEYERAEAHVRAALEVFEEVDSRPHVAESALLLGHLSVHLGDLEWAESCFFRARTITAALGNHRLLARCESLLGMVRTVLGRVDEAVPCTLAARQAEEPGAASNSLAWLAVQHLELGAGRFTTTLARHTDRQQAAHIADLVASYLAFRNGHPTPTPLGNMYVLLGIDALKAREKDIARMCYRHALPICADAGFARAEAKCHEDLGLLDLDAGRLDEARTRYLRALELYRSLADETNQAIVLHQLGQVGEKQDDPAGAEDFYRRSIAIKERLGNAAGVSNSTFHLGRVAASRGDPALAERCYDRCLAIDQELGNWEGVALDYAAIGRLRIEAGDPEQGIPLIAEALLIDRQIGSDNAPLDANALRAERARLGEERFDAILTGAFGPEYAAQVRDLIAVLPRADA